MLDKINAIEARYEEINQLIEQNIDDYAKTNELKVPDCRCSIGGNTIAAQTLDLSTEFDRIKDRLNRIADDFLAFPSPAE